MGPRQLSNPSLQPQQQHQSQQQSQQMQYMQQQYQQMQQHQQIQQQQQQQQPQKDQGERFYQNLSVYRSQEILSNGPASPRNRPTPEYDDK